MFYSNLEHFEDFQEKKTLFIPIRLFLTMHASYVLKFFSESFTILTFIKDDHQTL